MSTQSTQDYLKAIFELQQEQGRATTSALAEWLDIAPASVTGMVKRLAGMGLLDHSPYHGVQLTPTGRARAVEVLRHHRLVELYLAEALGMPWDRVHEEAEKWEHVLSEDVEERMDAALGRPSSDPHGQPIPSRDGTIPAGRRTPLVDVEPGCSVSVAEVNDKDAGLLRYLGKIGLYPNVYFDVVSVAPFDGPITVRVNGAEYALGREAAGDVLVEYVA